jgi:hypothetical protein
MAQDDAMLLSPWYLNTNRLSVISDIAIDSAAQTSINRNSRQRVEAMNQAKVIANRVIKSDQIPNLLNLLSNDQLPKERVLASVWTQFTFKGLSAALRADYRRRPIRKATLRAAKLLRVMVFMTLDLPIVSNLPKSVRHRLSGCFSSIRRLTVTAEHNAGFVDSHLMVEINMAA